MSSMPIQNRFASDNENEDLNETNWRDHPAILDGEHRGGDFDTPPLRPVKRIRVSDDFRS